MTTIATILPQPRTTYFDTNDNPLSGGLVYFYVPNTTTLSTTWQDAAGATPNSNPVVLDGNGSALIYGSGEYFTIVYDQNGNEIYSGLTQDVYQLVTSSNNVFTGTNTFSGTTTFSGASSFSGGLVGVTNGGFINKFRNGGMNINQRGLGGTITAGVPSYSSDGWIISATGANVIWVIDTPSFATNYSTLNAIAIAGATGASDVSFSQRIESSIASTLANQICTVQFGIANSTNAAFTPTLTVQHASSADSWSSPITDVNAVSLQICGAQSTTQVSYTFLASPNAYFGLSIKIDFGAALNSNTNTIFITGADLRATPGTTLGLNNNPPTPEFRDIATDLLLCQRYLPAFVGNSSTSVFATGQCANTTQANIFVRFPVPVRAAVTSIASTSATYLSVSNATGSPVAATSITLSNNSFYGAQIVLAVASGLVAGNATIAEFTNSNASLLFLGAEL